MTAEFDPVAYINEPRWQASRLGLERISAALDALGRPQDALSFVHVAGTNGKGSTCAYISSICRAAGLKTGLFTSPYIERFEERIQVNGQAISYEELSRVTRSVQVVAEELAHKTGDHLTEFELMCAVALVYFAQQACDIVVLEVGLGGRLDSTNVIDRAEVDVITRIDLDHTALLGDTLEAIAGEKAAIIKPGAAVVSAPQTDGVRAVIEAAAHCADTLCFVSDQNIVNLGVRVNNGSLFREFSYKTFDKLQTSLLAGYQIENAALALEAALALRCRGFDISDEALRAGIAQATWPGRFEIVQFASGETVPEQPVRHPAIVVDGGHNPQGARALAQSIREVFAGRRVIFVMGVLADKAYGEMIEAVADLAKLFIAVTPDNPRALAAHELEQEIRQRTTAPSIMAASYDDALELAMSNAENADVVCFFGSLYAIADVKNALRHREVCDD